MAGYGSDNKPGDTYFRMAVEGLLRFLALPVVTFLSAGRLDYWQGWVFHGLLGVVVLVSLVTFADKADLIRERLSPGPGVKAWDKVWFVLFLAAFLAVIVVAPLDVGRFGWGPTLPTLAYAASCAVLILSILIIYWATWTNRFFSSMVRIQSDRGQEVVQNGPYRFVRHPGYVGGILFGLSCAAVLGSLWALIPGGLMASLLVVRTYLEDVTLQRELAGYSDYAKRVKYRLLLGLW